MAHTRKDVWKLGAGWSDTLTWYARGVSALQQRPITDRTSWTYLASLHGFDEGLWRAFGYFGSAGAFPAPGNSLPLSASIRAGISCPGIAAILPPSKPSCATPSRSWAAPRDWALPYWNYSDAANPRAGELPPPSPPRRCPTARPTPSRWPSAMA